MFVIRRRHGLIGLILAASGALAAPPATRAQAAGAAPAAQDSTPLLQTAAAKARLVASQLDSQSQAPRGRAGRPDPGTTQYLEGVSRLVKNQFDSALVPLRAAVLLNQNSARYHGDLAYALAGLQRWEDAGTEYATAIRLQGANPWYYVGLAAVRASQERWPEAGANFSLAMATDSSILDPSLVAAASFVYERGGNEAQLFEWSRLSTQRFPNDAAPWLRYATLLRSRGDTAQGLAAIRRFHSLQPDDHLGAAVYSLYLYDIGQNDSAVAFARHAAADSSLREYASAVYLRVGARLLQAKQYELAAQVLNEGRAISSPASHARYSFYIAHSNIQRLAPLYSDAVQKKDCPAGRRVDSLLVSVEHDFRESAALDSAQTNQLLTTVLPQFRTRLDEFLGTCRGR
jgi:tetratricopeptide (TPR) repeat protein